MSSCCANPEIPDERDDFSICTDDLSQRSSIVDEPAEDEVLETSYSRVTPLFSAIEKQNWEGVLMFLKTSKWSNSMWVSEAEHMRWPSPKIQCRTWIHKYKDGRRKSNQTAIEWSQLPLHGAISFSAPAVVLKALVEMYPKALELKDSEEMLPLHLAFGFGLSEASVLCLLEAWPKAVTVPGPDGRWPHQCCELGPNKTRGALLDIMVREVREHKEQETEDVINDKVKDLGMHDTKTKKLLSWPMEAILQQLVVDRKHLVDLKEKIRGKVRKLKPEEGCANPIAYKSPVLMSLSAVSSSVADGTSHARSPKSVNKSPKSGTKSLKSSGSSPRNGWRGKKGKANNQ